MKSLNAGNLAAKKKKRKKKRGKKKKLFRRVARRATRISLSCRPTKPQFLSGVSRISTGCFVIVPQPSLHRRGRRGDAIPAGLVSSKIFQIIFAQNILYFDSGNEDASREKVIIITTRWKWFFSPSLFFQIKVNRFEICALLCYIITEHLDI